MVSRSNAWWMTRTKGIYQYNLSPFKQRAFAGFPREIKNIIGLHWRGFLSVAGLSAIVYGISVWAEDYNRRNFHRKIPGQFDETPPVVEGQTDLSVQMK